MIKLQEYTPEIYYKQSRDFQYIGRLYDLVLNSVKTNTDMIYSVPESDAAGSKMIDLLALTLGFKPKHNYSIKQLSAICSIFSIILRNKGNISAIEITCNTLLHSEGIWKDCRIEHDQTNPDKQYLLELFIPQELTDLNLLRDLLDYILPAGMTCNIIRTAIFTLSDIKTNIIATQYAELLKMHSYDDSSDDDEITSSPVIAKLKDGRSDILERDLTETDKNKEGLINTSTIYRKKTEN